MPCSYYGRSVKDNAMPEVLEAQYVALGIAAQHVTSIVR